MANLQSAQQERARQRQQQLENQRAQEVQAARERAQQRQQQLENQHSLEARAARERAQQRQQQQLESQQSLEVRAAREHRSEPGGAGESGRRIQSASTSAGSSVEIASVAGRDVGPSPSQRDNTAQRRKEEQDTRERKQQAQEESKRLRVAEQQAQRDKQAAEQVQAKAAYLAQLQSSIRLKARQCFGGQYIVGIRPRIKPEEVSCVDVHYRAQCTTANNNHFIDGVGKNFVGMGEDCFTGDTYTIEPKLSCDVKDISVTLKEVRECNK